MRKLLKWTAIVLVVLFVGVGALALVTSWIGERKMTRVVEIAVTPVAYVSDEASIARGKYLYSSRGCGECHGADGAGHIVINAPNGLYVKSPNITSGSGSVVKGYTESDWVRTVRHGVGSNKHALFIMPSRDYNQLTDADLAAVVAYVRSLPPMTGEGAVIRLPLMLKSFYGAGAIKDDAETIDHSLPPAKSVPEAVTPEHGAYVANMCQGCHGSGLSGGKIPGSPPEWPPAANLTPGKDSVMSRYDSADKFSAMLRTGKRPDGSQVSAVMPFATLRNLNDTDVGALYAYLKTVPPRPAGER